MDFQGRSSHSRRTKAGNLDLQKRLDLTHHHHHHHRLNKILSIILRFSCSLQIYAPDGRSVPFFCERSDDSVRWLATVCALDHSL